MGARIQVNAHGFVATAPEQGFTQVKKTPVVKFSMPIGMSKKDQNGQYLPNNTWLRVTAFGQQRVDYIAKTIKKGSYVFVSGDAEISSYVKKDNSVGITLEVVANSISVVPVGGRTGGPGADYSQTGTPTDEPRGGMTGIPEDESAF